MDKSIVTKMIDEKQLVPNGITNVMAYGKENSVSIDFLDLKEYEKNTVILLFWNYYDEKALCIHEYEICDGQVNLEISKTLMMQMKYLDYHSMRIAIVYQENGEYVCKYLKNEAATDKELSDYDRWICKLGEMGNQCLIAFWVENGMLSVGLRDTKKFDSNFYKFTMASYEWNDSKFIAYLDAPLFIGAPQMSMCSMSTNQNLEDADINLILIETSGIKNLYRMEVELSNINSEDVDGYRFVCNLANHNFKVVTDEDTIGSDDIYYVQLETNDRLGVGIKKKKDNTFILQTGVYDCMLSIVTAVYNTAPFLAEMIDSVLQQDVKKLEQYLFHTNPDDFKKCRYKNIYEFILVDDGSTDGSAEILDDYARIADCIKVIHKENGGVSSARNVGIESSSGEYVKVIDCNTKITTNFVNESLKVNSKDIDIEYVSKGKKIIHKKLLFSIIMSIYNVEPYIEEAIDSIIEQDIGFEENVQLILVNDGSTDHCEKICQRYVQEYPDNILYLKKENGGQSSARNLGINYVKGEYVNFCDPDDTLSLNVLSEVKKFFDVNYEYVDMVCIPLVYFEAQTGLHAKYKPLGTKNRIISLVNEPQNFILSAASSFYKAEVFNNLRFDERMLTEEDTKVNVQVLRRTMRYGYVCEEGVQYNYRRRSNGSSNVDAITSGENIEALWAPIYIFDDLFPSNEYLAPYEKELIAYELRSRLRTIKKDAFPDADFKKIINVYGKWISKLDDEFISKSKWLETIEKKVLFLNVSNRTFGDWVRKGFSDLSDRIMRLRKFDLTNNSVRISCTFNNFCDENIDLILFRKYAKDRIIYAKECVDENGSYDLCIGDMLTDITHVRTFEIPIENGEYYFAYYDNLTGNISVARRCSIFEKSRVAANIKGVGPVRNGYCISVWNNNILITNNPDVVNNVTNTLQNSLKQKLPLRALKQENKKYILISDRPEKAGDNGQALFEYIMENEIQEIKNNTYFVISKRCDDYKHMKYKNHIVDFRSKEHLEKFLNATIIFSSHNAVNFFYPFETNQYPCYADLLDYKFVWLQHGVTKDNIQKEANKLNTMDDYIITASKWEFEEFSKPNYLYQNSDILLTGFARFDKLVDRRQKLITIAPTWRKNLVGRVLPNGHNEPKAGFINSLFYKYYSELLTNQNLIDILEKEDYQLNFVLHSGFTCYENLFECINTDRIHLVNMKNFSYQQAFAESSLFITDYSSTAFDFAYMKKPIIYFQFDEEEFFEHHYSKGSWDYREDGFGPVINRVDVVVDEIIYTLKNGCQMPERYKERVDKTFAFIDKNNCKRIMDSVRNLILI